MTPPKFSIVIPTYNRATLVPLAVESVLSQDFDGVEVVVSDNHSTDETKAVLDQYVDDDRVRVISPPEHGPLPVHWEWARSNAKGTYINLLSDDDALVPGSLARISAVADEYPNTTIVGRLGEYFGPDFPDDRANRLNLWNCGGGATLYPAHFFLKDLYKFKARFDTHPTGWFFPRLIAEITAARCGSFFKTNGAEYHAIPAALAVDPKLVHIDEHIGVVGRTPESIGTKIVFTNPGQDAIDEYVADTENRLRLSPVDVACFGNLISEGLWAAKQSFPMELQRYPKSIESYVTYVGREFEQRRKLGVRFGWHERQLELLIQAYKVDIHAPDKLTGRIASRLTKPFVPKTRQVVGSEVGFVDVLGAVRYLASLPTTPPSTRSSAARSSAALSSVLGQKRS